MNMTKIINNFLRGWEGEIFKKAITLDGLLKKLKDNPEDVIIHCITHTDLDGIGVELVMRKLAESTGCGVEIYREPVHADDSFEKISKIIDPKDYIVIGDLSFSNPDFVENIFIQGDDLRKRIVLLDHHKSAMWLQWYDFAYIKPHNCKECIISSGTILTFLAFKSVLYDNLSIPEFSALEKICDYIAAYDTYFFNEEPVLSKARYGSYPNDFNILFKYYSNIGKTDKFIETLCNMKWCPTPTLEIIGAGVNLDISEKDEAIIEVQKNNIQSDINRGIRNMSVFSINSKYKDNLICGVYYYSGAYISEIGHAMCQDDEKHIDFALIIDMNRHKVSMRCESDDLDLTKLIEDIPGSGGHPKACGFEFNSDKTTKEILDMLK